MEKNIQDERVINEKSKIINQAFYLIMIFLISSILVQQYVFKAGFKEYLTEAICFFGGCIYIIIRNISVGNSLVPKNKSKLVMVNSFTSGLVIALVSGYNSIGKNMATNEIIIAMISSFLVGIAGAFVTYFVIIKLNERKIKKLEAEFDDDDLE